VRRKRKHDYKTHSCATRIEVVQCGICGKNCTMGRAWTYWYMRPARTCSELAAIAGEALTPIANNCEQWKRQVQAIERHLWSVLWQSPIKNAGTAVLATTAKCIRKYAGDTGMQELCETLRKHRPDCGEAVRFAGKTRRIERRPDRVPSQVSWIKCRWHQAWCAAAITRREGVIHRWSIAYLDTRRLTAESLIAAASRSCDEFRARHAQIPWRQFETSGTGERMGFAPTGSGRWARADTTPAFLLHYNAQAWALLAPAFEPWEIVAAKALGGAR
jgi:hypothetical protein